MRTVFLFRVIIIIDTIYKKEYNHPYLNTVLKSEKKSNKFNKIIL